ncbi:MAG: helix-turn-helix transcriptional regulator, partial [Coriobacteriales bacterium]
VVFMYVSTRRRIVAIPASLLCACTIANVIGITVIVGMQVVGVSVPVLAIAAVLGICLGFVALTWGWMDVLGKLDVGEATFACLLAFVLSHLFGFVDLLPRMAAAVISASYPAFSCMSIWQCLESQGLRSFEGVPLAGRFLSERAAEGKDWSYKAGLVALLLIVTVIVSSAFLRSIYSSGAMTYDPTAKVVPVYLVSLVVGTLIMLVIARWGEKARCALALGIASLAFFTALCVAYTFGFGTYSIPVTTGLSSTLTAYLLGLVATVQLKRLGRTVTRASLFCLVFGLASGVTYSLVPAALSCDGSIPTQYQLAVGLFGELIVLIGMVAIFVALTGAGVSRSADGNESASLALSAVSADATRADRAERQTDLAADEDAIHEMAVAAIAETFGLTERELETASLVAKGFTAKRVAEELSLSVGTVQTYCKNIYRKMGIHKKDELIDAVESSKKQLK